MRPTNAFTGPQWRSLLVVAAVVWALVAVGAHSLWAERHAPHPLLASLSAEFVVNGDHPHLVDGSHHPEQLATAVLPQRSAITALVALGVVVAALMVAGVASVRVVSGGRGPPWGVDPVVAGQDLLIRFCLARR